MAILLYNSLIKMNYLYYQFWTKESLSFSEAVAHKCSIKELRIKFCQNSLATLFKKRTPTQVYFREFSEILLKNLSCRTPENGWFWILQLYLFHSIICFIKVNSKKGNYYFWMYLTGSQHRTTIAKRVSGKSPSGQFPPGEFPCGSRLGFALGLG